MIWPCALFFILAAIRLQEPPMHIDNCYLEPRNLPSHGIYPFIQSLLCNAGSSCKDKTFPFETNNTSWSFEDDLQEIDISLLKEIQELSQDILETTEKESSLYKLWEEMFNFNRPFDDADDSVAKLNIVEKKFLDVEKIHKETLFGHSLVLPWLNGSVIKPNFLVDVIHTMNTFLKIFQRESLDLFPSITSDPLKGVNVIIEALMHDLLSRDGRHILHFWNMLWDPLHVSFELESMLDSDKQLTQWVLNITSMLREISLQWNISSQLQMLIPIGIDTYISLLKTHLVMKSEAKNGQVVFSNMSQHQQLNFEENPAEKREFFFPERFEKLSKTHVPLKQPSYWHWVKTFLQLSNTNRRHVIETLNLRKEALKYLQIITPFLKNISVDGNKMNIIVTRITEMLLNVNSSSCENVFELLKIHFQLPEDISITKDLILLICSYFESFSLPTVIDNSEMISEPNSEQESLVKEYSEWQKINHLLQENMNLSSKLSHLWDFQMTKEYYLDAFQIKNMTSLLHYILNEMGLKIERYPSWDKITDLIIQACLSSDANEIRYINSSSLGKLCHIKYYNWTTFIESVDNVKRFFSLGLTNAILHLYDFKNVVRKDINMNKLFKINLNSSAKDPILNRKLKTTINFVNNILLELNSSNSKHIYNYAGILKQLINIFPPRKQTSQDTYGHSEIKHWVTSSIFYYIFKIFSQIFVSLDQGLHDNRIDGYAHLKKILHPFFKFYAYNCSDEIFDELNLLQQEFTESKYNSSTNPVMFNVLLQKPLETVFKISAYLKCLNDGNHSAILNLSPNAIKVSKDAIVSFLFEKYSSSLQAHITKMRSEAVKMENVFRRYHLQSVYSYLGNIENLAYNLTKDLFSFDSKHRNINFTNAEESFQNKTLKHMQSNIQSDWIISTIGGYLDLVNISTFMFRPVVNIFHRQYGNNSDFRSEKDSSEEPLFNISMGCHDILQNTLTNFIQSIFLGNVLNSINNTFLLYNNISVEEIESVLVITKACFSAKTFKKVLSDFNTYFMDNDTDYTKSVVDFLKLHCRLFYLKSDSSLGPLSFFNLETASISLLNFILQEFVGYFLHNPVGRISYNNSRFDVNSLKPVCDFLQDEKIKTDKDMNTESINSLLLNYVNRFHEYMSSESAGDGNITSEHLEPVLFLIISRYAVQNLTYAYNFCSLLNYPYRDFQKTNISTSNDKDVVLGFDVPKESYTINILCKVISKAANIEVTQNTFLDILSIFYNLTDMVSHLSKETIASASESINVSINHLLTGHNNSITTQKEEKSLFLAEKLKNVLRVAFLRNNVMLKPQLDHLMTDVLYKIHSIMHDQVLNQIKQDASGSLPKLFFKENKYFQYVLLFLLNVTEQMMDDHGDDDDDGTGYDVLNFLISENSSNGKFPNVLEKANEIFIKLLNGSRRDENFIFLLSFIKQHDMYNDVEHLALERIIWQLKSLLMNDIQAKQFVKTFSQYYSWMRTSGHSNQNQIKQLINSTLLISKALFSTFQLLSKLSKYHTIKAFMEYLQEGFLTTKNLSDICQSLYKNMDSEDLELLKNLQKAFRNTILFISENPQFIGDQICILSQCIDTSPGMLIVSLFEGINLFNNQFKNMENSWTDFGDFDCTSFILTSKQLFDILINFTIINTKDDGFVCNSTVECTQQPMKKLMLNLNQPHPYSTVETLFSNNTRFQDLKIRDILKNASVLASKLQSSANISEEMTNTILRMELSKLKNFHNVMSSVVAGNCDEDILGLLLEFTTKEETSITVKEICNMPPAKVYQIIVNFIQNMNFQNLVYKVSSPHELETILRIFSKYITYVVKHFEKFQHTFDNLLASSKVLKKIPIIARFQQVIRDAQPKQSILLYLHSLASSICKEGPSFFSDTNIFIDKLKVSNLADEDMKKYNIPEESPPFCLQLYQEILQSPNGAIAWTFLKPLLHGKILYTPDVPEVRQIIHKANHTFSFLENLKGYSEAWLAMSIIFKNSDQLLKKTQLQTVLLNSFIRNYLESQLNLNLGDLVKKIQVYEYTIGKMLNSTFVKQINYMSQFMVNISSCFSFDRFLPINTSEALEKKAKSMIQTNNFLAGIIFNISSSRKEKYRQYSRNKLPPHVKYTIRTNALYSMKTDLIKNPIWRSHPRRLPGKGFTYSHVFAPIQDMIDRAIISVQTGSEIFEPEVQVQAMPYPCHTRDHFLSHIGFFFPLIMMLAWIISVASMVRKLVFEKEIHLEEYMKIMGVHAAANFLAWFLENIIVVMISSSIIVLILKLSGILVYSNGIIFFLFLLEFGISIIMFSYLISEFFTNATTAALCGSLLYMISFLPYIILLVLQKQFNFATQCLMCLLSTTAFGQGIFLITRLESEEKGIQWNNFFQPIHSGAMSFNWTCWMILIDSIIYFVLGWCLSNIMPGIFGHRKALHFPLICTCWQQLFRAKQKQFPDLNMVYLNENQQHKGSLDEKLHLGVNEYLSTIRSVVSLYSVSKIYSNKKMAVKDLSLNFYENQITALLGPNGAGKTTILSMLNSQLLPTLGKIFVNGRDMQTELSTIRTEMGVCPQYDVLFENLTIEEHLLLFGALKMPTCPKKQLYQEVKQAIKDVDLFQHRLKYTYSLSGGMKRRLSIAIALIGNAKTIVLDEPTSGVDPCSRRSIWDILLKHRQGRTIIFTTHNLDEAEFLSDRIAIIQNGTLTCCGSPSSLKQKYGHGHELTLIKTNDLTNIAQVTSLVQEYFPSALLNKNTHTGLVFVIPGEVDAAMYKHLFQRLDNNLHPLHISGYGITGATMEKVYLQLLQNDEHLCQQMGLNMDLPDCKNPNSNDIVSYSVKNRKTLQGAQLYLIQMTALLVYKFHHTRRDWKGALANIMLPVLFVTMAMGMFNLKPLVIDDPPLKLSFDLYSNEQALFFSSDPGDSSNFSEMLLRKYGDKNNMCIFTRTNLSCWHTLIEKNKIEPCKYFNSNQDCPMFDVLASSSKNGNSCILYNLSGLNIEEYVFALAIKDSYGGWSFTRKLQSAGISKTQAKVWYSQKGFHALPSYLNYLNNVILWKNLPSNADWKQYGITVYSKPYQGATVDEDEILENVRQCGVALCITLGFSILTASIGSCVVKDHVSGAKYLYHISGLNYKIYWIGHFLHDMALYLVPASLCVCVIASFQLTAFTFRENLAASALLLILFGYATLPWMYLVSGCFPSSDAAFISYTSINFVSGLCTLLLTFLPRLLAGISKAESLEQMHNILKWTFLIFPQFCLGHGLMELAFRQVKFDLTKSFGTDSYISPFELDFLGWVFMAMAIQGSIFLLLRLGLNGQSFERQRNEAPLPHDGLDDMDVELERRRLLGRKTAKDRLLMYNLRKCYQTVKNKNVIAVRDICLGIQGGECFGLLGLNGAGKSTIFKILVGEINPTCGRVVIKTSKGHEMNMFSAYAEDVVIGYCPQKDALDNLLTGWEHLYYYCKLRGISKKHIHKVSSGLCSRLGLDDHIDKLVGTYSGGTKRKLSAAIALIGRPQILLLDEPSSGMDPCSKRQLWKAIKNEVYEGCAAVLTSHSMEECEALCTRLAIMVNGSFKCIGSPQHIKNRFGDGYSVIVQLNKDSVSAYAVSDSFKHHFPGACLKGQHLSTLEYHVAQQADCLGDLFYVLDTMKKEHLIESYSITQTSLEQVFIQFAAQQEEHFTPIMTSSMDNLRQQLPA